MGRGRGGGQVVSVHELEPRQSEFKSCWHETYFLCFIVQIDRKKLKRGRGFPT